MGNQQVVRGLSELSNTIRGLGRDKSQHEATMTNLGLQKAKQEYDIGRQTKADARADELYGLQKPGRELAFAQDTKAQQDYNAPVTMATLMGSPEALEHFLHTRKGTGDKSVKGKANIDIFLKDMGWKYKKDEPGMPIYTKSGQMLKKGEFPVESYEVWLKSNMDPKRRARGQREKLDYALRTGKITPEAYQRGIAKINEYVNNIPVQVAENEFLIEKLSKFDASWAKKRIERLTQKNDDLLKEQRGTKNQRALVGLKARTKSGSDEKPGRFTLKNTGKPVTVAQLKTLWKQHFNLPDELSLMLMEADPKRKADVEAYKKKISVNSFRDFVNRMTVEGDKLNWDKPQDSNEDPLGIR